MVGFGLDYACANIIPASVNLLPIQADFVTERDTVPDVRRKTVYIKNLEFLFYVSKHSL